MVTDKELKKMTRMELLQLLILEARKNDDLENENRKLKEELQKREILIRESGSLAEAALKLNGIFEAAEAAARDYVYNRIRMLSLSEQEGALTEETEVTGNG